MSTEPNFKSTEPNFKEEAATIIADLRKALDASKERTGAIDAKLADHDQRLSEAKKDMLSRTDVQGLINDLIEKSKADPAHRQFHIIRDETYSQRMLQSIAGRSDLPNRAVRKVHDNYMMSHPNDKRMQDYHRIATQLTLLRAVMTRSNPNWWPAHSHNEHIVCLWEEFRALQQEIFGDAFMARAFDTAEADEWVPTILGTDLLRFLENRGNTLANFPSFTMPAGEYAWPTTTAASPARSVGETTAYPSAFFDYSLNPVYATTPTGKILFSAAKLRAHLGVTGEFEEESVIPALPFITEEVGFSIVRGLEQAILNGGTADGAPDFDLDVDAAADGSAVARARFKGVRQKFLDQTGEVVVAGAGSFDAAKFILAARKLGKYWAQRPSECRLFVSAAGFIDLIDTSEVLTMEKFGPRATIATGQLAAIYGTPIVMTDAMRDDVASTGFNTTGGPNTTTSDVLVNVEQYKLGNFRGVTTERDRLVPQDLNMVFAWWRGDFKKMRPDADPTEAIIANIAV